MNGVTTWAGLPLGDLATWAAAAVGLLAFGAVVLGLFIEGSRRKADIQRLDEQRHEDQISQQARLIGGYLEWVSLPSVRNGLISRTLGIHVINASQLPVRNVQGILTALGTFDPTLARSETVLVLVPGGRQIDVEMLGGPADYQLQLQFDDDAGIQWTKYGSNGLTFVKRPAEPIRKRYFSPGRAVQMVWEWMRENTPERQFWT